MKTVVVHMELLQTIECGTSGQNAESWESHRSQLLVVLESARRGVGGWDLEVREGQLVLEWEFWNEGDCLIHENQRAGKGSVLTVLLGGS